MINAAEASATLLWAVLRRLLAALDSDGRSGTTEPAADMSENVWRCRGAVIKDVCVILLHFTIKM